MSSDQIRAFVNELAVNLPSGSVALDAVRLLIPEMAAGIEAGRARLTDSRGLPVDAMEAVVNGAIYRVVPVRERTHDHAADPS